MDKENLSSSYSGSEQSAKELSHRTMKSEKSEVHQESVGVKRRKLTGRAFKSLLQRKCNNGIVPDDLEDSRTSSVVREILDNSEGVPTNCSPAKSKDVPEPEIVTCLRRSTDDAIISECVAGTTPRSAECENCSLLGTCIICSTEKRISYNSQEKELCTCDATTQKETHSNRQMDDYGTVCVVCNSDGDLLCCEGRDCKRHYHLSCLDSRLPDDLPGVRHCPKCVDKRVELGVYAVSEGVESIWDAREVEVPKDKGIRQKQYLVKYHGLAHIHNHWVPEKQLLLKHQSLVSNFIAKDETARWSVEWTVPRRLLRKRPIPDKFHTASSADISESYEWLVKWHGLDYDHATWELDSSYFLSSSLGRELMTGYETRCEKAKREVDKCQKGSFAELSDLPASGLNVNDNLLLKNVNKLRECWYKCQNTVVFDDQDRAMTLVLFIQSLTEICHPFLIVAASDSLSQWEAEFAQLAPSVDVVVYNGNVDTRKGIRASEFYEEGGCVMLQVLLSSPEAVFEDLDMLSCIRWQSIVIDEYRHSKISIDVEQIKILTSDLRILLLSGQIKDTTSEYLNILSLLDSEHEYNKLRGLRSGKNENLAKLKERLSRFIAYGSTSNVSKFLEYWVPVRISNYQLEQYCATLISNSMLLCSCSRNDKVGALWDILLTLRKCCDHPYLVDSSIQEHMIAEGRPADEILDVGIKACGKLQLLEMMLTQVKAQELKVLVIFQSIGSGGSSSTGYILSDFLAQKFGQDSYEHVFSGGSPATKQAAVNRFNKKENGQFVLLLENRACSSTIKLLSLDVIVLYNSDWNPANDFKALQKISIDLAVDQIKVLRLYSSCTVEERALVLAKKNLNLDNNLQASSRASSASSDSLLMWGAACLFSKLDDYHSERSSELNSTSGLLLLNEVTEEFESILSECGEISKRVPVISKVKLDVGNYSADVPMLGEAKVQLKIVDEPHIFWRNLLDRKSPRWKHIMRQSPRNRKRVHYLDGSLVKSDTENDDARKKRRSALIEDVYQASAPAELQEDQATQVAGSEGGPSSSSSQSLLKVSNTCIDSRDDTSGRSPFSPEVDECGAEERNASSDEQKSLHNSLQEEMERLCQILKLSEDVTHMLRRFLEYVISNHPICRDSPAIMQAFQISLLWVAASISKQEVDKTESLILAKQLLNYQCTEEQVHSVYSKVLDLKWKFLRCSLTTLNLGGDCLLAEENTKNETFNINEGSSPSPSVRLENAKMKIEENSTNEEHCEGQILSQPNHTIDSVINEIQRKCSKRMKKLIQKQKQEFQEFYQNWEKKKLKLETNHKLASTFIRCTYGEGSGRTVKLKLLDSKFAKEMEENNLQLKDLEAKQLAAKNEEREKAAHWIAKAKAHCSSELGTVSTSVSPPAAEVGGIASIGTPSKLLSINQPKLTGEIICANLPPSGERVPDEIGLVELNKEVPPEVPENVIVDNVNPGQMNSASNKGYDKGDTIGLPNALVNQRDGTDDKPPGVLTLARQISEPLGQTKASLHRCDLLPPQVPENQNHRSLSAELQDQGAHAVEDQNTFQFQVAASEAVDSVTIPQSNSKLQDQDAPAPAEKDHGTLQIEGINSPQGGTATPDAPAPAVEDHGTLQIEGTNSTQGGTVTPLQSNDDEQAIENCEKLNHVSIDVPPCENQSTAIEVENQSHDSGKNSSRTTEGAETEMLPNESASRIGANLEMQTNYLDIGHETNVELSAHPQNNVVMSQEVVGTVESASRIGANLEMQTNHFDIGHGTNVELSAHSQNNVVMSQEVVGTVESASRIGANLEMQTNHLDIGHETNVELSAHSQNNVVMSQEVVGTVEPPNQAVLHLGIDLGHQDTSWDSPSLFAQLFQNQLENICRETEQLEKSREEMMSRLKSEFEKEVQEIIAQALKRYQVKLKDAEAEYILKKNGLGENHKKVYLNKILAKAFSFICEDLQSSGLPGIQQDIHNPSGFMQQLPQLSLQHSVRHPPVAMNNLQAFRPAAPSLIPQHNLQSPPQKPPTTSQHRPEYQDGPPALWGPSVPTLELLRAIDRQSRVPGGLNFFGFT